jgi:hypothetical protein
MIKPHSSTTTTFKDPQEGNKSVGVPSWSNIERKPFRSEKSKLERRATYKRQAHVSFSSVDLCTLSLPPFAVALVPTLLPSFFLALIETRRVAQQHRRLHRPSEGIVRR